MKLSTNFKIILAFLGVLTFTVSYLYFDSIAPPPKEEIEYIPLKDVHNNNN